MSYECRVTIAIPEEEQQYWKIEALRVKVEAVKWSFSCIEGDPQLGERILCYATNYYPDEDTAIEMTKAVAGVLVNKGLKVVRSTVAHVVFDTRSES